MTTTFPQHTLETAPTESRPHLETVKKAYGSIPNLMATFAGSPALLEGYLALGDIFDSLTAFDATERQVVLLATSYENECDYCMAAHTAIAGMQGVDADVIESLRKGEPLADTKLRALHDFTQAVVAKRGWVEDDDVQAFITAGYTKRHVLEVVLGVGLKTLSNFTNHVAQTPLDAQFKKFEWSRPAATASASA
ncbi:MAG: carboxymuconolactone decarboxylase family protein [Acidobacteriota bacterium]